MLKIKKKKYSFKYVIYWKDNRITDGEINNSTLNPVKILLNDKMTKFSDGQCTYFNSKEIKQIVITDLVEKVGSDNE